MNEDFPLIDHDIAMDSSSSVETNAPMEIHPNEFEISDNQIVHDLHEMENNINNEYVQNSPEPDINSTTTNANNEEAVISGNRRIVRKFIELLNVVARGVTPFRFFPKSVFFPPFDNVPVETSALKDIFEDSLCYSEESAAHWDTMKPFNTLNRPTIIAFAECMRDKVIHAIYKEVEKAVFFSWHINGIVKLEGDCFYYPIAVRFVSDRGKVMEHLVGLFDTYSYKTPCDLSKLLFGLFERLDVENKLVAQCYDGALLDVPEINELKDIILSKLPRAILSHSASFTLNSLAQKAYDNYTFMFFGMLKELSQYFYENEESQRIFTRVLGKSFPICMKADWKPSSELLGTIIEEREKIVQVLTEIMESKNINFQVCLLKHNLEDFSYVFLLYVFYDIFVKMEQVEEHLQKAPFNVEMCRKEISACIYDLKLMKSDDVIGKYVKLAEDHCTDDCGGDCNKNRFNDSDSDPKHVVVYETLLESVVMHLEVRLSCYENMEFLELLNFDNPDLLSKTKAFESLSNNYGKFFDLDKLKEELQTIYFKEMFKGLTFTSLLELIVENGWHKSLPQTYKLLCLFGALPAVKDPNLDISERIKEYVSSTKFQEHFAALPLLQIERETLQELQKAPTWDNEILLNYAARPECCVNLLYKRPS